MRVRYTLPALADLHSILEYIVDRSPRGALRVQQKLYSLIELTLTHPFIGTQTDDPVIRKLVATPYPYLVFYEARHDEIIVHAIRHSSRDPSDTPS